MFMSRCRLCGVVLGIGLGCIVFALAPVAAAERTGLIGIGQPATVMDIQAWNIDV